MNDKFKIRNQKAFRQAVLFKGIDFNNMRPTDIDLVMEVKDKLWILIEMKHVDNSGLPVGQRLLMERFYDNLSKTKTVLCAVAVHDHDLDEDIDAANCLIHKYYRDGKWHLVKKPLKVVDAIEALLVREGIIQ